MARPTKYSVETADKICDALEKGATRRAACGAAAISEDTLANWLKSFSGFSEQVETAEAAAEVEFSQVIYNAAKAGSWKAAFEWLKRRRRQEWGDNAEPPAPPPPGYDLDKLSVEELNALRSLLEKAGQAASSAQRREGGAG